MVNFILVAFLCIFSIGVKAQAGYGKAQQLRMIVSGGNPRPFVTHVLANHQHYASFRALKYKYFYYSEHLNYLGQLKPNWIKIIALKSALNDNDVPENSWIAWVDDDAVIDDFEHLLSIFDRYIQTYGANDLVKVIAAKDCNDKILFNSGVLIFQKGFFSRKLVDTWWEHRPKSDFSVKDQAKLIEVVKEQGLILSGIFKVVPQREHDLNLNTFTDGFDAESCSANPGDFVTQPAGAKDDHKTALVLAKIDDLQQRHPFGFLTRVYLGGDRFSQYISSFGIWDVHPKSYPKVSLRGVKQFVTETLNSEEFYKTLPVISVLTVISLLGVYCMVQ